ncbi:MAG: ComEA family DNA-binding protein [Candidatus Omnitrophica bacterium]|nr:ComEA family DNA-binding protein [Candidatus Omnitrophota bacterium]
MLNLTHEEKRVIIFIIFIFLSGLGIDFFLKSRSNAAVIASFTRDLGKININEADSETLLIIPGIGEKLARRIIEYRELNGKFTGAEDLKKIKGITGRRYEKLKDSVFVE